MRKQYILDIFAETRKRNRTCVAINMLTDPAEARKQCGRDVGYFLGYYSDADRQLWYSALNIQHPIFPSLSQL